MMVKHRILGEETIAAIATPLGVGGIGTIRVSGSDSLRILRRIFRKAGKRVSPQRFRSHRVVFGQVFSSGGNTPIDNCLATYMKGPSSYTGEDVVEIGLHGSIPILQEVLRLLITNGARLAVPGEFTRRAFLNGRLDLSQAEAVLDVVNARTSLGARRAVGQLEGTLSKAVNLIREKLLLFLAEIEAGLDFPDDVREQSHRMVCGRIAAAQASIRRLLATAEEGRIVREGARVAIVGRPNVGKSSLYNALLREERAIVTGEPGTTRDALEEELNIRGMPVRIIDTAGLRPPQGQAEAMGVACAQRKVREADLILLVVDGSRASARGDLKLCSLCHGQNIILVINKCDLPLRFRAGNKLGINSGARQVRVSALFGKGLRGLERAIFGALIGSNKSDIGQILINSRHQQCLLRAEKALREALVASREKQPMDIISIGIKDAVVALGEITGQVVTEEVLDKIFSQFCVGK